MAASSLDASIIIGPAEPQMGWLQVSITFSRDGREVDLGVGDSVQCNGIELSREYSDTFQHPRTYSSPGLKFGDAGYVFTYRHYGNIASIRVPSFAAPKITSPQTGALLDRGAGFTMTYEPARGGQINVMIYQTTSDDSLVLGGREEPDTGTYAFDASMLTPLKPGPGWAWLELHQQVETRPSDTGFKSVAIINNAAITAVQIHLR
jgi:hypothetical protein